MSHTNTFINQLRNKKFRITQLRKALIKELGISKKPLSVSELMGYLKKKRIPAHKTSVYRELIFLIEQDVAKKVTFGDKKDRFELAINHHHHAVCEKCGDTEDLLQVESQIEKIEKMLLERKFKVENHLVEFLGLCKNCQ